MPDEPVVAATPAPEVKVETPPPTPPPMLLAGKYADQPALEKGIREARKAAGFEPLPEKLSLIGETGLFADTAAAEREYKRLDAVINAGKAPKPAEVKPEAMKIGGEPLPQDWDVPTLMSKAGLDVAEVSKHFLEKGDLTDDQYKKIQRIEPGLSRPSIKFIAEGLQAKVALASIAKSQAHEEAARVAGGADQLKALLADAVNFVPEKEQAGINRMLGDPATMAPTIRMLKQMHAEHVGAGGSKPLINGTQTHSGGPDIKTIAEYKALVERVRGGDKTAQAMIMKVDVSKLK